MSVIRKRSLLAKQYEQNAKDSFGKLRERMIPSGASSFSIGRASGWKRPPSFSSDLYLLSIELIEAAENGLPRSFMIRAPQAGRGYRSRLERGPRTCTFTTTTRVSGP
jgi:hypothetical protein